MDNERIAVLETEVLALKDVQKQILGQQAQILEQLTKYKGFIGGVLFVGSTIGTFLVFAKEYIFMKLGIGG